ncbi:uncharacterized protein PgNI_00493 [Pyricularia grisea]|uniref:Transmembrane protein n=1 Tax=Pyricularia grisea TaxID=148305 RepID=A0A6P8BL12_PYRGI|nr:uncharacterized protein PgNI_00493 [Pyricularia grisea]TLD17488.1 hypothetical protein PgNI_00493 [Pyricularia grisea]
MERFNNSTVVRSSRFNPTRQIRVTYCSGVAPLFFIYFFMLGSRSLRLDYYVMRQWRSSTADRSTSNKQYSMAVHFLYFVTEQGLCWSHGATTAPKEVTSRLLRKVRGSQCR